MVVSNSHPPADEEDEELDNQLLRLPPVGPPSWDSNVVCIQPTRNLSRPEGHEDSEEKQNNNVRLAGATQRLARPLPLTPLYLCAAGSSTQGAPGNREPQRLCERWSDCLLLRSQVTHSPRPPHRSAAGVYSNVCEAMILQLTLLSWQQSGGGRPRCIRHMLFISVR